MYPLLDTATVTRRAAEGRRAAEAVRAAKDIRGRAARDEKQRHGVRHALGTSLVRAGVRLTRAGTG